MALAAIFVAAEHFSSIGEAKKGLDKTQGRLKETGDRLEQALVKSQTSIDTLLNADGIGKWRRHVYRAYRDAKERIDAVIREFDIDDLWWELDGNWNEYFAAPLDEAKGPTLYQALVGTGSKNNAKGADKVHFVGDIEVRTPGIEHGYPAFGNLLGLTWWLVVIHESMETRRNGDGSTGSDENFIVVRVASSASWMHAIGDSVYQVIEREKPYPTSVRLLSDGVPEGARRQRLSQWAHDDIRRTGRRGCDGEEYVCAVLRLAALDPSGKARLVEDNELTDGHLAEVLSELGMPAWLEQEKKDNGRVRTEQVCVQLFRRFIRQSTGRETVYVSDLLDVLI